MKLLFAGHWAYPNYEEACARVLESLGVEVIRFSLSPRRNNWISKFEFKYSARGPHLRGLQRQLLLATEKSRPDVVLIWLGMSIFPETLRDIKQLTGSVLASYVHDDPFAHAVHTLSPSHHRWYWREFLNGLADYDLALFSKQMNVDEAYGFGARRGAVLRQYFVPEMHRPLRLTAADTLQFGCDAAFAGHYEPDGRLECIQALAEAGLKVHLYTGTGWDHHFRRGGAPPSLKKLPAVFGEDYTKALCGADMCLCFLAKMNRDQYTTRCFEIPACGRLMVSERTDDLLKMFREDEEAVFFSSPAELIQKVLWLRNNPLEIRRIAAAGMRRVHADRHSVVDRVKEFLALVSEVRTGLISQEPAV